MTAKEYDNMIRRHVDKKDLVEINRTVTDGSADITGFILKMSRDFLLIQNEEDMYLDGYGIIKKYQFDSIRCHQGHRTIKRMLKAEGIFDAEYGIQNEIRLTDWSTIIYDLKKYDYRVIIECENLKKPLFLIGPILKVNKTSVQIQYFNSTGLLDEKPTTVKYKDITLVRFDQRYINIFKKYLRTK